MHAKGDLINSGNDSLPQIEFDVLNIMSGVRGSPCGFVPPGGNMDPAAVPGTKLLRLGVIAGHSLAKKDIFGASDPYLRIDLIDKHEEVEDTVLTKTKKRTLNPKWDEEFVFRVRPNDHKLVLEVFDENRLTRDDFLGMVELPLFNMPKESENRTIPHKHYILRPRSARSKVRGHLQLYHGKWHLYLRVVRDRNLLILYLLAFIADPSDTVEETRPEPQADAQGPAGWEVVATSTPPATSLDGASNNTEEPYIVEAPGEGAEGGATANADAPPSLPAGWEERQDNVGRTYYVNHVCKSLNVTS